MYQKRTKKLLSVLLALAMLMGMFSMISVSPSAEVVKTNIALNATATADGQDSDAHAPSKAVDGVINREATANADQSRWGVEDGGGNGTPASHWLKVDLGSAKTFNEVVIDWERKNVTGYKVEVSDNDADYREIYVSSGLNTFSDSIVLDEAVTAQYVKVTINSYTREGNILSGDGTEVAGPAWSSVSIYEVQLLQYAQNDNLATGKTATANGSENNDFTAPKAVDGDDSTRWASKQANAPHWIQVDLGQSTEVAAATIHWERNTVKSFEIQYSDTAEEGSWKTAYSYSSTDLYNGWNTKVNFESPVTGRHFRIYIKDFSAIGQDESGKEVEWNTISIFEIGLYGKPIEIPQYTLTDVVNSIEAPEITADDVTVPLPEVPEGFEVTFAGSNYDNLITPEGKIAAPLVDKQVKIAYEVTDGKDTKRTADLTVTVPGKVTASSEENNAKPVVIPEIAEWIGSTGDMTITESSKVVYAAEDLKATADLFAADYLEITGMSLGVQLGTKDDVAAGDFYLELDAEDTMTLRDEGYYVNIADGAAYVTANTTTGARWATVTFLQILKQNGTTIPQGEMRDYPKYEIRGFMLDVGRLPIEMETIYDVAKTMSWYKLNDFELHLNDNLIFLEDYVNKGLDPLDAYSAFRMESDITNDEGEGITASDLYYTKDEFRKLITDSRAIGVNIVPEFDFPAHSLAITSVFEELAVDYINPGNKRSYADHFDLSNPESTELIKRIWDEYLEEENPVFDELTTVNVGADEYTYNKEDYRRFVDTILKYIQQEKNRTVRIWGSLSTISGTTPVYSQDVQMYIWNTGWANPKAMLDQGYDLININDGSVYIVPGANYYYDYLNPTSIYNNWKPNVIGGTTIAETEDQMLGGAYALWNDLIDTRDNGIYEYDNFDRFYKPVAAFSEKLWGEGTEKTAAELAEAFEKTSTAPGTNPYNEVETTANDKVFAEYTFDDGTGADVTGNGYNLTDNSENVSYTDISEGNKALTLNDGTSYVETPIEYLPVDTDLTVRVKRTSYSADEQILFESEYQPTNGAGKYAIQAVQADTGKVGFVRGARTYTFDYELPVGEWVTLTFRGEQNFASLYVNGELVDSLGSTAGLAMRATLSSPFNRIGSKTNSFIGLVDYVKAENLNVADETIISNDSFTVTCDNQNPAAGSEGPISYAFDNNLNTFWHSNYTPFKELPANIEIHANEGTTLDVGAITYVPRQSGDNGNITSAAFYYKNTEAGINEWTEITSVNWAADSSTKKVNFDSLISATDIKITVKAGKNNFGSAAEFYLHNQMDPSNTEALVNAKVNADEMIAKYVNLMDYERFAEAYNKAAELLENGGTQVEYDEAAKALAALNTVVIRGGDINGNGKVTVSDATIIQLILTEKISENGAEYEKYANVNLDSSVTILDATEIQKYICGIIELFSTPV